MTEIFRIALRNTAYNLASSVVPLLAGLITIPLMIDGYGIERYGVLSLAWVLIGYFSLADFGLSRALTKFVSERIGSDREAEIIDITWTSLLMMIIIGVVCGAFLALASPFLVNNILKVKTISRQELLLSLYLVSIGVPFTVLGAGLRGVLEGYLRFDLSSYIRIAIGLLNFIGPAVAMIFSHNIVYAVSILVLGRIVSVTAYFSVAHWNFGLSCKHIQFRNIQARALIKYGGWITISNIVSPIMINIDRLFLGAMVSVTVLAYYSTPWEVMTRLLIIPSAVAGVMFPMFSRRIGIEAPDWKIYRVSLKYVFLILFSICIIPAAFAKEIMTVWISAVFSHNSYRIMQIMALAVIINGVAMIPFTFIQGAGKPDITAKYHLLELGIYLPLLWVLIDKWKIYGAAVAWLIRVLIDLMLLLKGAERSMASGQARRQRDLFAYLLVIVLVAAFGTVITVQSLLIRSLTLLIIQLFLIMSITINIKKDRLLSTFRLGQIRQ